ncbi:MAG: transglycosylase domain-containing protein [Gemmiger sp.]|uniref:transglycosylase domain-containing protein n=1 Tax=Gemmiger sp. TaxID=2049027 RepID=UPI00283FA68A|nr:transglycosylase domain-containing protein [Gemmiger sp.]MDR3915782.1 transglycosylase domain-containing protein [Gemmiger sp.]
MQFRVTTLRYRPKEAVPIEPKQQRHISTDGVKTTTGATGQPGAPAPKNKKKPKKRRSIIGMIFSFIGCMLCLCIMAASVGGVLLSMYIVQVTADDAETLDLDNQKNRQTSIVYDINGNEYASLSRNENRIWRELSAMPENLQNAVIAIEDKNFRTEPGINLKGTIGAALNAFTGNRIWGTNRGASTLEQQLIKNLTGDNEQDNMRKVREIFRALGLDNKYSKETILEAYLNTIPLTGIIHGMEAGSIEYFGKHVEDLTLAECATLASITKNPTKYNPATNPEELIKRRNHVLYEMYTQGYITEAEFNAAKAETVTLTEKTSTTENATRSSSNSWFTDALYTQLLNQLQEDLNYTADEAKELIFSGGLRIYSTVDPTVQAGIEKTMYNEDDLIPALWHEEPVCLRDYPADSSSWDEVQYDEATGLPITKDGYAVYGQEAIPVYADEEGTTLKMGTSTDPDYPNDTTVYLCVYEKVRTQAAMATLDYDGNILGIGGGIGEKKYDLGFNRATSPHQTGSTMKPIGAYALALDYKLINYSSQILDSPYYSAEDKKVLKDQYIGVMSPFSEAAQSRSDVWRAWPTNYGGAGGQGNPMLVYDALQQSYNTVAVWVGDMVGVDYLYNFVHDTLECSYISAENDMDLGPLVLGSQSSGLTVVQLAGAYTMFNTGTFTTPHYYTEITDYQGNMILDNNKYINTTQAISADTAYIMNRMMWNVLHSRKGTAYGKAPDGEMDSVAKTGTTSNYKDYTFAGLTPYYVTAIWWGCDRPTEMDTLGKAGKNASPIQYAWKALMEDLQADLPVKEFAKGENVVEKHFDTSSGAIISSGGSVGYYTEDNLPDNSYTVSEDDPYAALAQAAADAAAAAGDTTTEPTE